LGKARPFQIPLPTTDNTAQHLCLCRIRNRVRSVQAVEDSCKSLSPRGLCDRYTVFRYHSLLCSVFYVWGCKLD